MRTTLLGLIVCMTPFVIGCGETESGSLEGVNAPKPSPTPQESEKPVAPQPDSDTSPEADAGAKMTVELLDPGAEPRTTLRYKFRANHNEKMVMEMSMAVAMEMGDLKQPETKMPASQMTMTIDAGEVSPEGDLRYDFELAEIDILSKPGDNPMMVNAMKQQLNKTKGLSGSATVTSRGFSREYEITPPPGMDAQSQQFMDQMKQSMNQISAPFPEEPVGKGGRWQVTMPVEMPAMKLTQIATYTLTEIEGDKITLEVAISQTAPPQEVSGPGMPPGTKMSLESLDSSGTGTVELKLTDLVPTSKLNLTTTSVIAAGEQKVKTTMRLGTNIHP